MKRYIVSLVSLVCCSAMAMADVVWYDGQKKAVEYQIQKEYGTVVEKALELLDGDMRAVTGRGIGRAKDAKVEIYQWDMASKREQKRVRGYGAPVDSLTAGGDAFWMGVREGRIVIVGANGRGTAYGIMELAKLAGVSPWIWWGDVVPVHRSRLTLDEGFETLQRASVELRGIFINDEDWSTRVWSRTIEPDLKSGNMGRGYYRRLFELMLRLRANALWPAMHEGTSGFFTMEGNREVADSFDIYVGGSHCEPILRNNVAEWDVNVRGRYNWITNRAEVEKYWRERARETANMDALYTIGMRGIHDGSMEGVKTSKEKLDGLQSVIDWQRSMLAEEVNSDLSRVPQVFIPYKEVLEIYESGLRVPEDVTLMWCDDNYGYMTRLSDAEQQKRKGGGGVYYHLSYWGRPHDYLWLTTTQPGLVYWEMKTAYDHNCRRLWIVNVHDPKVAAYDLSLFMDMAWDINSISPGNISRHLEGWLTQQFGGDAGRRLLPVMKEYYRLCGIRRPEFMGWNQVELDKKKYPRGWSPVQPSEFSTTEFGDEMGRYLSDYKRIADEVEAIEPTIRPELRDAFFAAIKYPVEAAAAMAGKWLQTNPDIPENPEIPDIPDIPEKLYSKIQSLTDYYNNIMSDGKWKGSMSMAPRGLYVFGAPSSEAAGKAEYDADFVLKDSVVARDAADYNRASDGVQTVEMLGHSMRAVSVPKGGALTYEFDAGYDGDATLCVAMIPTQPNDKGDLRYEVSVDDGVPEVVSLKEPYRSERWKLNVLRGQALRQIGVRINKGRHTLTIRALDDHIIVDQWMLDYKKDRKFYMIPTRTAL